jgi:hypothetical protein
MSHPPGRERLANRRCAETFDMTVGRFPDGLPAEIFVSNHKAGNTADVAARDGGILVSLLLQHNCDLATIARNFLAIPTEASQASRRRRAR